MLEQNEIMIKGLHQNNLKNIDLKIPKGKIVVFTGVSGSGKSSIVFDTIAAESQRQMNETYPPFVRGKLPKYKKSKVDRIENLSPSVIIDQSRLGGNARSTVGTITDLYASLRVLFSRIGQPFVGTASHFSFNDPNGMCPNCSGMGKVVEVDMESLINPEKSWEEGMVNYSIFAPGSWYWKKYKKTGLFDPNKKWKDFTENEKNILLYGDEEKEFEGLYNYFSRVLLKRDLADMSDTMKQRAEELIVQKECPVCHGKRLNRAALECQIQGYHIAEMADMEFVKLRKVFNEIQDPRAETIVENMKHTLDRIIEIGLPYLSMSRETMSLSGGEAQRLKLVRYMGSSLTGMLYIFDEPSTGMHPRDVYRMAELLKSLRDKGNTVLVVEHDKDVISIADEVIDVGPKAGKKGGTVLFQGSYEELCMANTPTGEAMRQTIPIKTKVRRPKEFLTIRDASLHNLKHVSVDIPLHVLTAVTGVAGSGKSSLIRDVFVQQYSDRVVLVDQSPITASARSTAATYLGFFDEIRKLLAKENHVNASLFSFNSKGACPYCKGKGVVVTELVFMDPVVTVCEVCEGKRYSEEALSYQYHEKNIVEILEMTVEEAYDFFAEAGSNKIQKQLDSLKEVGLSYLSIGQPLSTLSGGERQRLKLAKDLRKKGNIYVLDEPTTGLHASDITKLMKLFEKLLQKGNTVIVIEHNTDVMKQAHYIIDIGPDGGSDGGKVVFTGTPQEMVEYADTITAQYLRKEILK